MDVEKKQKLVGGLLCAIGALAAALAGIAAPGNPGFVRGLGIGLCLAGVITLLVAWKAGRLTAAAIPQAYVPSDQLAR